MRSRKPLIELKANTHGGKFWHYKKNPNVQAMVILDFSARSDLIYNKVLK